MTGDFKNAFKVSCVYAASIIGAGFASGQEIVQFFTRYFEGGFYGILVAGALFAALGCVILDKVYKERIQSFDEFLIPAVGWLPGHIMSFVSTLFMLSVLIIMIAGAGRVIQDKLSVPFNYGITIMAFLCMMAILWDIKGVLALSSFIMPVLTLGIIIIGISVLIYPDSSEAFSPISFLHDVRYNWLASSLLYVGYNSIISISIMCSLLPNLKSRRVAIIGGLSGGLLLGLIALILNTVIMVFAPGILGKELPVLEITKKYGNFVSNIYAALLWLAMLISAVTSGYCFIDRLTARIKINKKLATLLFFPLTIPLAGMGFSNLISMLYPVFGYFGLFLTIAALIWGLRLNPGLKVKKSKKGV